MANSNYPPASFHFQLSVDGEDTGFQEASGLSNESSIEEIREGGINRYRHRLPQTSSPQNLILKRGLVSENSKLIAWCSKAIGNLTARITPKTIYLNLLGENRDIIMSWTLHNAYPVKHEISDLQSLENEVAIESIEFIYNYFEKTK